MEHETLAGDWVVENLSAVSHQDLLRSAASGDRLRRCSSEWDPCLPATTCGVVGQRASLAVLSSEQPRARRTRAGVAGRAAGSTRKPKSSQRVRNASSTWPAN